MGTKSRPGAYDCYTRAELDEPMFVLLARDPLAPEIVRQWACDRTRTRGNGPKVQEAFDCADAMEAWYNEQKKTPDGIQ